MFLSEPCGYGRVPRHVIATHSLRKLASSQSSTSAWLDSYHAHKLSSCAAACIPASLPFPGDWRSVSFVVCMNSHKEVDAKPKSGWRNKMQLCDKKQTNARCYVT